MSEENPVKPEVEEQVNPEVKEQVVTEVQPEEQSKSGLYDKFLDKSYTVEKQMIENVHNLYVQESKGKLTQESTVVDLINWLNGPDGANYQIPETDFEMEKYKWIKEMKETDDGAKVNVNVLVGIRGDDNAEGDIYQPVFYNMQNQMFWMFEPNGFKRGLSGIYINAEPIMRDNNLIKTVDYSGKLVYVFKWNANVTDVAEKIGSGVAGGVGNALSGVPDFLKGMVLNRGGRRRKMRKTKKLRKSKGGKKKSKTKTKRRKKR